MNKLIEKIVQIIEDEVKTPRGIIQVYKGDPITIPKVNMPAVTVSPISTDPRSYDSRKDQKIQSVAVVLILDAQKYINASSNETTIFEAVKIMEEEDSNLITKSDTILYAVRSALNKVNEYTLRTYDESVSYDYTDVRGFPTIEVALTFSAERLLYNRTS